MATPPSPPSRPARITTASTDAPLPAHVPNGYQKYRDFVPFAEGGSARLETCLDTNLGRTVILKRLLPELAANEVEQQRFLREARVTAQIAHPNTLPVYELSRDPEGNPYFTMKRFQGRTLRDLLRDLGAGDEICAAEFPLARRVEILLQVAHTVDYAHRHGIIHRDLKPANILIGDYGEVVVIDWGLAKVRGHEDEPGATPAEGSPLNLAITRSRYGTPLYMSPEQAEGRPDLDERADIYNLGELLYEMLALRPPVWGENVQQVVHQILNEPPEPPSVRMGRRNVPRELEAVCLKALSKEPGDRHPSVEDFIADLRAWQSGLEVSSGPGPLLPRLGRWLSRHASGSVAAACLALGALGATAGFLLTRGPVGHARLSVPAAGYRVSIASGDGVAMDLGMSPLKEVAVDSGDYRLVLTRGEGAHAVDLRAEENQSLVIALPVPPPDPR